MLPLSGLKFQNENSIVIPFEERYFAAPANMLCTVPMRLFTAAGFHQFVYLSKTAIQKARNTYQTYLQQR